MSHYVVKLCVDDREISVTDDPDTVRLCAGLVAVARPDPTEPSVFGLARQYACELVAHGAA